VKYSKRLINAITIFCLLVKQQLAMLAQAYNESLLDVQTEHHLKVKNLEKQCKDLRKQAHHHAATVACLRMKIGRPGEEENSSSTDDQLFKLSSKVVKLQHQLKESQENSSMWEKRYQSANDKIVSYARSPKNSNSSRRPVQRNVSPAPTSHTLQDSEDDYTTGWKQSSLESGGWSKQSEPSVVPLLGSAGTSTIIDKERNDNTNLLQEHLSTSRENKPPPGKGKPSRKSKGKSEQGELQSRHVQMQSKRPETQTTQSKIQPKNPVMDISEDTKDSPKQALPEMTPRAWQGNTDDSEDRVYAQNVSPERESCTLQDDTKDLDSGVGQYLQQSTSPESTSLAMQDDITGLDIQQTRSPEAVYSNLQDDTGSDDKKYIQQNISPETTSRTLQDCTKYSDARRNIEQNGSSEMTSRTLQNDTDTSASGGSARQNVPPAMMASALRGTDSDEMETPRSSASPTPILQSLSGTPSMLEDNDEARGSIATESVVSTVPSQTVPYELESVNAPKSDDRSVNTSIVETALPQEVRGDIHDYSPKANHMGDKGTWTNGGTNCEDDDDESFEKENRDRSLTPNAELYRRSFIILQEVCMHIVLTVLRK
jgi:hypothetical protein